MERLVVDGILADRPIGWEDGAIGINKIIVTSCFFNYVQPCSR